MGGGAFLVTKLSWRGRYHRILVVNATHILTFYPDSLTLTNSWALAGDHDLAGVEVGGEHPSEGGTFTLQFRRDKKVGARGWSWGWGARSALAAVAVGGGGGDDGRRRQQGAEALALVVALPSPVPSPLTPSPPRTAPRRV